MRQDNPNMNNPYAGSGAPPQQYPNYQPPSAGFDGAAQAQPTQAFGYGQTPQSPYGGAQPAANNYGDVNGYAPPAGYGYGQQPPVNYGGPGQIPPQIPPSGYAPFNGQQPPKNNKTPIIIVSIVAAVLLIACIVFAVIALNKNDDDKPAESPSSTYGQTASPKAGDDPFDDSGDDFDGLLGSDVLKQELRDGKTLEQAFSNPQVKKQLEEGVEQSTGDAEGMAFDVSAKDNTLIFTLLITDPELDDYGRAYAMTLDDDMCSSMSEFAEEIGDKYRLKDVRITLAIEDSTGKTIASETYGPQSRCKASSDDYDSLFDND